MRKKIIALLMLAAASSLLFANGTSEGTSAPSQGEEKTYNLKFGELNPNGHIMEQVDSKFAELVEEKSNGRIKITVFPSGQLGDEKTMYQSLQMGGGTIDFCRGNTNALGDFGMKKLTLFGLPFIFRDRAHLWTVLNSQLGRDFLNEPEELNSGLVGLGYMDEGSRNFFTVKNKPITSIDDFKGLKLRVPTTSIMSDTVSALGVQSTPISFSELYSALQTGTVDGAEQPNSGYYSNKFFEVAPNYILTGHTYSPSILLASGQVWNQFSESDQKLIREAAEEAEKWNRASIEKLDSDLLDKIKQAGAHVIEVPDKTPYLKATEPVVEKYAAGYGDLYNQIINM